MKAFSFSSILKNFGKQLFSLASQMPWCNLRFNLGSMSVLSRVNPLFSRRASHFAAMIFAVLMLSMANVGMAWGAEVHYILVSQGYAPLTKKTLDDSYNVLKTDGTTIGKVTSVSSSITTAASLYYNSTSSTYANLTKTSNYGTSSGDNNTLKGINIGKGNTATINLGSQTFTKIDVIYRCNSSSAGTLTIAGEDVDTSNTSVGLKTKTGSFSSSFTIKATSQDYRVVVILTREYSPSYTVTYDANGGSGVAPSDANTYESDDPVTVLEKNTLSKSGYFFSGWNTKANGTGTAYSPGEKMYTGTNNVTLYAQWADELDLKYVWKVTGKFCDDQSTSTASVNMISDNDYFTLTGTGYKQESGSSLNLGSAAGNNFLITAKSGYKIKSICFYGKIQDASVYKTTDGSDWSGTITSTGTSSDKHYSFEDINATCFGVKLSGTSGIWIRNMVITVAVAAAPAETWVVAGQWDSYSTSTNTLTGSGTLSTTISLAANKRYEFKIVETVGNTWYGNSGAIIGDMTNWTMATDKNNCRLHTGPAGDYTFTFDPDTKNLSVTYPSVTHPSDYYVYFKNSDVWGTVYGFMTGGSGDFAGWPGTVTNTTTICGETYHYGALLNNDGTYNKISFNNGGSGYGNQTSDLTMPGAGKYNANRDANWHDFTTYTISFANGGGTGTMSAITGICPNSNQEITANAFEKTGYTFNCWHADKAVKVGGNTIAIGGDIAGGATLQEINNNITLTAQWTVNSYQTTTTFTNVSMTGEEPLNQFPSTLQYGSSLNRTFEADPGYRLPETITVTGAEYTWNPSTGVLSITNVTGEVSVTITGIRNTYTVTYNINRPTKHDDGETETDFPAQTTVTVNAGGTITLPNPSIKIETITVYTAKWKDTSDNEYSGGEEITPTGDMTLTAQWTPQSWKIGYYESFDGTNLGTEITGLTPNQYTYGLETVFCADAETIVQKANKTDYTWLGWWSKWNPDAPNPVTTATVGYSGEFSLFAKWNAATTDPTTTWNVAETVYAGQLVSVSVNTTSDAALTTSSLTTNTGTLVNKDVDGQTITATLQVPGDASGTITLTLTTSVTANYNESTSTKTITLSECPTNGGGGEEVTTTLIKINLSITNANKDNTTSEETTGTPGGTAYWDKMGTKSPYKLNTDGAYVALKLSSGYFQNGDVLKLDGSKAMLVYTGAHGSGTVLGTTEGPSNGVITYTLDNLPNNTNEIYIYRSSDTYNGTLTYMQVDRTTTSSGSGESTLETNLAWSTDLSAGVNKQVGDANFTYTASSNNSAGTITYSSSDESVATVADNGQVTIVDAGTTTITATIAAIGCYPEKSINYTLNVTSTDEPEPDNCGISECGNATLTYTINASTSTTNTADNLLSSATASNTTALGVNNKAVFSTITADEKGKAAAATNECFNPAPVMSSKITMHKGSSYNANTYLQFTFTVKSGYTFTPCDVQFIVQPVMSDANFRWVITDGTTEYGSGTANDVPVGAGNGATALLGLSSTSAMPAGTYYIRLYPYDNDGDNNSFRISNDVILKGTIEEVVCTEPDAPTAFTVGLITSNGATFTITDEANTNNYEIYYSTASTAPTAETEATITTTEKTKAVTGLTAETTYYAWARAICNEEKKSSWVALTNNLFTTSADPDPSGCITITDFDEAQKTSANGKPDANSKYLYGYTSSEQPYAITTTSTNNDGGEGKGAYIRLDHNSTIYIYSNEASTTTAAEGFADITSISLKIKLKKSAPTITIKVGETTIANAVSLNGANADDFVTFTYSGLSRLDGAVSIKNNDASSSDYNIYVDDIKICTDAILYTVTFDPTAGTVDQSSIQTASTITLPAPTRDGDYTFTGWWTAATGGTLVGAAGESYTPTADITLYAQWEEKTTYNITYELNGANWVNAGAATYDKNTGYTLPKSNDLSNYGYTFVGWYDNAGCTGTAVTSIPTNATGDKTFYAKWEQETFSITYELNSGTNPTGAKSSYTMFDDDYDLPTPTRNGYTFIGWFSDAECTQGPITILPSGSTGDKTFYAKWGTTLTETWTITKIAEKLQRGGGNYTVTVYLNNADWDASGNKDDLELTATEGVVLRNIEKTINTDGKAQVTAIFDITTNLAVDAETITFKLSVPTAGNYAAAEFTHSENLDECAAGSPTEISIFKGTADGDNTNTSDAEKYKQDKTWTHTETGLKNTSKGVKDNLFEITWSSSNAKVNGKGVTYVRGIQQGGSNAENNHFKLEIPETYTASIYIVYAVYGQSGYFSLGTTQDTPGNVKQADELWHSSVSSSNKVYEATINNIQPGTYYLLGNSDKCIFAEIKVTMIPTTGGADVNLTWDTLEDLTKTIEKGVGEPDFVYTATTTSNTLGAITYRSSDESVATVNQTTGLVDIHAAGTTTITATLASSGCYAGKSISYKVEVLSNCTDVAGDIVYADGTSIENDTITKACNDVIVLKLVGHTQKDGITYQWYKNGEVIAEATDVTYTIPSADEGSYYVVSTNSGEMGSCSMASNNTIEVKNQGKLTVTKLIDYWYVKNNRRTPDIALVQTKNATDFEIKSGENPIEEIGGCTFYLGEDGIIYLKGKQDDGSAPSGMTAGDINLSIAVSDACENSESIKITIHIQATTERPSIAFVVDGTQGGEFSAADENHSTNSSLYKYLHYDAETNPTGKFDLTACNIYSTTDEKLIREHYSQFDAILVTDDPSTKIPNKNYQTKGYVNAFGTMIDIRPILTMEAFVSALANWSCVKGNPSSPSTRQYEIRLECKDHEIYGTGLPAPKEGTNVWDEVVESEVYRHIIVVDSTKSPYTNLKYNEETSATPALQGFTSSNAGDLLGLGRILNNTLHAAVERQQVPEARLLLFGIQNKALPNALTDEGKQVIANILTYLLKTNMEEVDDCSNFFVGGDAEDGTAWTNENNWAKSTLPTSETKVRILAPCVITNTIAKVAQIDIATSGNSVQKKNKVGNGECNGSLTISPDAALVVEGAIKKAVAPNFGALSPTTSEDLKVLADQVNSPHKLGALIHDNKNGETSATVQMWNPSYWEIDQQTGKKKKYWSYVAVPIQEADIPNFFWHGFTYLYDETQGWIKKGDGTVLYPFQGIGASLQTGNMETFYGKLATTDNQNITLTKTDGVGEGQNLIGNSWTAPIQIANFEEEDFNGATSTVYVYNTGRDDVYKNPTYITGSVENDGAATAGQWIGVPISVAGLAEYTGLKVIPAMNAFQVNTTQKTELHLDYDRLVRGVGKGGVNSESNLNQPMRAPHKPIEALMRVRVAGEKTHTDLWLLQDERFDYGFDNGWEAEFVEGDDRSAQLYAVSEIGKMTFLAQPELDGTLLGFAPSRDGAEYTFSFYYTGSQKLYLNDLKLQTSTLVSDNDTYLFTYEKGDEQRFIISTAPFNIPDISTGVGNTTTGENAKAVKFIKDDKIFIFVNGILYDATGKMVVR